MATVEEHRSEGPPSSPTAGQEGDATDEDLPQCKIKRNYSCNLCSFFSQNPRSFLYHSRDVHFDKIKIYECSKCLYASKHSQKLQRHINMIHVPGRHPPKKVVPKRVVERREVKLPSPTAVIAAESVEGLEAVMTAGETKVKCSICSFTSRSAALITRHERVVHSKKRNFRCTKCSYVTHVKARFTKHVKYHSMPMIKCDLCDFRTPYKWNLDRHYKNHCGSGAFQCSKCNFRADIKQSLTVHEMNHHVPPVGAGAAILMRKKKNKVGASETTALESDGIDQDELELLRLEREEEGEDGKDDSDDEEPDLNADPPGKLQTALNRPLTSKQPRLQGAFIHPEATFKPLKCRFCSYRGSFPHEITRHEKRIHGFVRDKRPPPNLIPIQGKPNSPILKIPEVRSKLQPEERTPPVNEEEFNEMCKKSSLTSSLKEFVSLIGDEEALKTIPDASEDQQEYVPSETDQANKSQTELLKRKNSSFFDKLKEKLVNGGNDEFNLMCELCGHESKCLSESVAHEKKHSSEKEELVVSGTELSSTRCQHCRHRCKTSADLITHLKACKAFGAAYGNQQMERAMDETEGSTEASRVFVWNEFPRDDEEGFGGDEHFGDTETGHFDMDHPPGLPSEILETQLETSEPHIPPKLSRAPRPVAEPTQQPRGLSLKKVFKCPHCSFWASTASRFHVHIVGHLNKKPFECSLCSYRSNWRWDITKHIRLKSARDPNHALATVNMTDETGRRNYSKYNKYLTMMKVHEPTADSSGTGRRTRACEATQGTVREGDILQPIPEPPKLTPAPTPGAPHAMPHGAALRPPPPLQAAHLSSVCKRTLWKCKKCLYRNSDKEKVLAHVKSHYSKRTAAVEEDQSPDDEEVSPLTHEPLARNPYKCGHCHQVSNWRQVIQRHCRVKHNGIVKILPCTEADKDQPSLDVPDSTSPSDASRQASHSSADEVMDSQNPFACDICPFTTETAGDLTAHKLNHVDRPGSIFKCTYCPFYVPSKIAVLEHMEVHGVERGDNWTKLNVDNFDPSECWDRADGDSEESKRYRCKQCPYVSNSKTQFLYHKQFHRPRDAPFKCMYCSYNVSRRHLLHQHLRVHHMYRNSEEDLPDIPLVWVLRGSTYLKMFKCRWCPHVNVRRVNIQEHEKMHRDTCKLQCPDCSYTCNNPGVLSSHVKVHAGYFGEIRSLVDPTRPDEEQIQTLQNASTAAEPEILIKVEEPDAEPSTPESSYYQSSTIDEETNGKDVGDVKTISFCNKCPARFFYKKELRIHSKFHLIRLPFKCSYCSYTARQRPHLLAHFKVHSQEYQERTAGLVDTYMVCPEHQPQKTAMVTGNSDLINGPVWSVISAENLSGRITAKSGKPQAKHSCHRCPAKFFKPVALQYHLTLHGGAHQHRCKYCDYTVKTYGNLIKHQLVHEASDVRFDRHQLVKIEDRAKTPEKKTDPQFGVLMHGSPNFIYPTYLKNGKLKEKRYKCHKCPSAFEKRDQYRIHLSLHGSKQKYKCEKCDYSVKYYANYIQHMKKHKSNEEAHQARDSEIKQEGEEEETLPPTMIPPPLTQIEKQTLLLLERKRKLTKDDDRKIFNCELCPYLNMRRDCLENHERRHFLLSGVRYGFNCGHCDYSTTQANFLREHRRVHFKPTPRYQPEAFLHVELLELWYAEEEALDESALFKECGNDQFYPPVLDNEEKAFSDEDTRIFINPSNGEPIGEGGDEDHEVEKGIVEPDFEMELVAESLIEPDLPETTGEAEDLIEMVEEQMDEKPKVKRLRGKNWRCKKCPHAFGKRDQFMRHVALHGSKQRYSCDICDYSVKFYTNYVQHMRMHQSHEPDRLVEIKQYVASPEIGHILSEETNAVDGIFEEELDSDAEKGAVEALLCDTADADGDIEDDIDSDSSDAGSSPLPLPAHLVEMSMVESEMEVVT